MNNLKVVTIGGGSGSPTVIKALILAGITDISAISTSTDSGGRSGRMRTDERDRVISVGDLFRNLLALISPEQNHLTPVGAFMEMSDYTDGRYRNLGYQIYYSLLEKYRNNFLDVQHHLERLMGIRFSGTAIPVTLEPTNISFSTKTGAVYHGEHELDRLSMSTNTIEKIWLDRQVNATPEAIKAINAAAYIIYSPGSIYGSIIVNFLPAGITAALKKSKGVKILISNLVSNRNQTHNFTPTDYYRIFKAYTLLSPPFDILISPDISRSAFEKKYPVSAANYLTEHSHFLGWDRKQLARMSQYHIKSVCADLLAITPELARVRHDPQLLSHVLKRIIQKPK